MKLLEFLQEKDGSYSSTRLFMLLVCLATIVDWMNAVFTVGVWSPEYQTIAFVLGAMGFKVFQKDKE